MKVRLSVRSQLQAPLPLHPELPGLPPVGGLASAPPHALSPGAAASTLSTPPAADPAAASQPPAFGFRGPAAGAQRASRMQAAQVQVPVGEGQAGFAGQQGAGGGAQAKPSMSAEAKQSRNLTWSQISKSLLAGGVAGAVSRTAVAPLERLKIMMQIQGNEKVYTGIWQGVKHMWHTDGIRGLFKGNGLNCIRIIPNSAIKFLTYEQLSRKISHHLIDNGGDGQLTPLLRLAAGAGAGIVGMSATYPLDMVRGRITIQEGTNQQYRGMLHATRMIVREEGLLALWRGWLPSVIGVVPYVGLNFAVYETAKDVLVKMYGCRDERELSIATRLACGAVAGTTGQTVAYPFDVCRRRLQVSGWQGARGLHADHGQAVAYRGMVDCFVRTVREEGMQALFKGLAPNYLKVVPSIAIAFATYEEVKEILGAEIRISD